MEHLRALIDLMASGRLDDALRDDFWDTIACACHAVGEIGDLIKPDHVHPIGELPSPQSINGTLEAFADCCEVKLPASTMVGPSDEEVVNFSWITILLPIIMRLIDQWMDSRQA